jgi:hypothetical protein
VADTERNTLIQAFGSAIPASVGVLLGMAISNNLSATIFNNSKREIKRADIRAITDAGIGYLGYFLANTLDKPFIKTEIYGVGIGMMVGCWARLIIYILYLPPIRLISADVAGVGKLWK